MMTVYRNEGGKSGVAGYELGEDSITILSPADEISLHRESCGRNHRRMKKLARQGGLNSFIGRQVRDKYASRSED
jgi:hypothetical protein